MDSREPGLIARLKALRFQAALAVLAVMAAALGLWSYDRAAAMLFDAQSGNLNAVSELKARELELWVRERLGDAAAIAGSDPVRAAMAAGIPAAKRTESMAALKPWLEMMRGVYQYEGIELYGLDRERLLISGAGIHARLGFQEPLPSQGQASHPVMIDFHREGSSGNGIHLSFLAPVRESLAPGARQLGWALLTVDPNSFLYPLIQAWPGPSPSAESLLVRKEGNEVVFLNLLRHNGMPPLTFRKPITSRDLPAALAVRGETGIVEGHDYRQREVVASLRPVKGTPWFIVAKVDKDELYQSIRSLMSIALAIGGLIVGLILLLGWLHWRQRWLSERLSAAEKDAAFHMIIDHSADAIMIAAHGRHTYANAAAGRLFGYTPEVLGSLSVQDMWAPEDVAATENYITRLLTAGQASGELFLKHQDGTRIPLEVNAVVLPDGSIFGAFRDISARKRAEAELRESEARFKLFVRHTPVAMAMFDRRMNYLAASERWLSDYGLGPQELIGLCHYEVFPDTSEAWKEIHRRGLAGESFEEMADVYHRADGSTQWLHWQLVPWRDLEGAVQGIIVASEDITARREAEERIRRDREQQALLRELLEIVLVPGGTLQETLERCLNNILTISWLALLPKGAIFLKDVGAKCLRMAAQINFAPELSSLCNQLPLGHCLCGRVAEHGRVEFSSHVDDGHTVHYPGMPDHGHYAVPLLAADETIGVLVLYLPPGTDPNLDKEQFLLSVAGILASYINSKHLEEQLDRYREHLEETVQRRTAELTVQTTRTQAILKTLLDGVIQIDDQGIILNINDAALAMFGYEKDEVLGRDVVMLMPERFRIPHRNGLHHPDHGGRSTVVGQRIEVEGLRKDGRSFPMELATNVLMDDIGLTYIGSLRDLTQQKEAMREREAARAAAEELARAKSDFLANMSHEIRTPLNGVLGMARIGHRDSAQGSGAHVAFGRILESSEHLLNVINDILDFSKIEAGKMPLETRPFRLDGVVSESMDWIAETARAKGLALASELPEALSGWVLGDPLRLRQILLNLLSNAVKFTPSGQVALSATRTGDQVSIRIADTGIGMTSDQVSRLFTAFEQADGSTTRRFGGTGLGLVISRRLARLMGGDIGVESQPAQGSSFTVTLPLPEAPPGSEPEPKPEPQKGPERRLAGLRVLAAEDVEVNRLVLEDMLRHEGAAVVLVENGQEAVEQLTASGASAFDVVLMDVQMPVMDGYLATERIREQAPALPVIGLTAHTMAEERARCLAAGMVDHVSKPVDLRVLVDAILKHTRAGKAAPPEPAAVPSPIPSARSTLLDWDDLQARFRPDFVHKLLGTVLDSHQDTAAKIRAGAAQRDFHQLAFIAHSIKGVGGNIRAQAIYELAQQIHQAAVREDPESFVLAEELAGQMEHLLAEVEARLGLKHPGSGNN